MGLSHLIFEERKISFKGGSFDVKGLSIEHVMFIMRHYGAKLNVVVNDFIAKAKDPDGTFNAEDVGQFLMPFITEAPEIVAAVIATSAGDPRETAMAARLPLPVQIEALEAILELTFDAVGGPKKLLETVLRLFQGANGLLSDLSA